MQVAFNSAGERAWGIVAKVNFADFGVPGLTGKAVYAAGHDRINSGAGQPIADRNETNVRLDWSAPKGSLFEGLIATLRYPWVHEDGAAQTGTQLRASLNYVVCF